MAARNPVSSSTSRAAVTTATSPGSALPLGRDQSSYRGRCTSATRIPCRRDGRQSTAPAARITAPEVSFATRDAPAEQFILDILAGPVRRRLPPTVRTQHPATGIGPGDHLEQRGHSLRRRLVLDLDQRFHPTIEVAVHHVRTADPVLLVGCRGTGITVGVVRGTAVTEVEDPRMLQE